MKNMLLVGDSIRLGYAPFVQKKLQGRMNVYSPDDNGRFAQYTLRVLSDWKSKMSLPEIHVVHWNNGLWDVLHLSNGIQPVDDGEAAGKTAGHGSGSGEYQHEEEPLTPPEIYAYMLKRVLTRIRTLFPAAEVIFATTTPVLEGKNPWGFYRSNAEIQQYNAIARETLVPRGVRIHELGKFAEEHCSTLHRDWVHYDDEGCSLLAGKIVSYLEAEKLL